MLIGLEGPNDTCLDLATGNTTPCNSGLPTLLCWDPSTGQHDQCGNMPGISPLPVLTLGDVLQRCPDVNCSVTTAAPTSYATGGPCDPLIMAAGYSCQGAGNIAGYVKQAGYGGNLQNGQLYTSQGTIAAPSANQMGLTPQQTQYLMDAGIINPLSSMNEPVSVNPYATAPTTGPGAPQAVLTALQQNIPIAAQLPTYASMLPSVPMTPAATGPNTVSLGIPPAPTITPAATVQPQAPTAGTIPGSNTALAAATPAPTDLISGIPNTYLYVGAGALLLLLVMSK